MRILVTGATGFIGSHLCQELVRKGFDVVGLSRSGGTEKIRHLLAYRQFRLAKGDIEDSGTTLNILTQHNVDVVFHLAVAPQVPGTNYLLDPFPPFRTNTTGTLNLLCSAYASGVKRFIYASTIDVYSEPPQYLPVDEKHPTNPLAIHGASKLAGELFCRAFSPMMQMVVLRYSVVYGSGEPQHHAIPRFIGQALRNEPLTIYGDGNQTNDFVHIKDVVHANILAVDTDQPGIYNIGCGEEVSILQLARMIIEMTRSKSYPSPVDRATNKPFRFALDISKAREVLGYSPGSLEHGLMKHIQAITLQNPAES